MDTFSNDNHVSEIFVRIIKSSVRVSIAAVSREEEIRIEE